MVVFEQAKPETVKKVVEIVKKQLALPEDRDVCGESKFATLGADSLDTVMLLRLWKHEIYLLLYYTSSIILNFNQFYNLCHISLHLILRMCAYMLLISSFACNVFQNR